MEARLGPDMKMAVLEAKLDGIALGRIEREGIALDSWMGCGRGL